MVSRAQAPPTRLRAAVLALVWALPFTIAVSRAASTGQWRDDLTLLRDVDLAGVGLGGGVSTLVTQALSLLPLGPLPFRSALGAAIASSIAARLVFALAHHLFEAVRVARPSVTTASGDAAPAMGSAGVGRLGVVLAGVAALGVALGPPWQREATVGGGAMIATALALGVLVLALRASIPGPSGAPGRSVIAGLVLLGALVAESPHAALPVLACGLALLAAPMWLTERPALVAPRRTLWVGGVTAVAVAALLLAPSLLRPLVPHAIVDVGHLASAELVSGTDTATSETTALAAWSSDLGLITLGCAVAGVVVAASRRRGRLLAAPLLLPVAADVLWPARAASIMAFEPMMPVRMLALAALSMLAVVGIYGLFEALFRLRVPMARAAAVLFVSFHVSMIALSSEEAGVVADRSQSFGAEEWADVALGRLEPASALVVRDPVLVWRLWAAQRISGGRPDVAVIPVPLLGRGRMAAMVVRADASTHSLLRSYALTGAPGEYELSKLADRRPLHVEYDPQWSNEITSHLIVDGVWLEYAPQPLGPSDRLETAKVSLDPIGRVLASVDPAVGPDPSTAALVARGLRGQATVLSRVGDAKTAAVFLDRMGGLSGDDPFAARTSPYYALAGLDLKLAVLHHESD